MFCTYSIRSTVKLPHYSPCYNWILPVHHHEISRQRGEQNLYTWKRTKLITDKFLKMFLLQKLWINNHCTLNNWVPMWMLGAWRHPGDTTFENSVYQKFSHKKCGWVFDNLVEFHNAGMGSAWGVDTQGKYCSWNIPICTRFNAHTSTLYRIT